jgi:hypothetical protein
LTKKPDITTVTSGYQANTALNLNFTNIRDQFDNTLSLDGATPNAMLAAFDMNGNRILNLPEATQPNDPMRKQDIEDTLDNVYELYKQRYLGAFASDPTADNDGGTLIAGAVYYNTIENGLKYYTGSGWYLSGIIDPKAITILNPTGSDNVTFFYNTQALPISSIVSMVRGTSPSITFEVLWDTTRAGSGTSAVEGGITVTSTTTGLVTTSLSHTTIPANRFVWVRTTASSGTVTEFSVTLNF